jgi:hypothetical protein
MPAYPCERDRTVWAGGAPSTQEEAVRVAQVPQGNDIRGHMSGKDNNQNV